MKFIFRGKPEPQGRPRLGKGYVYDPPKSKKFKQGIASDAEKLMILNRWKRLDALPVRMRLVFVLHRPKRPKNKHHHITKPDLDNLAKAVKDALNGVAYADDSQITELAASKRYCQDDEPPGVIVEIMEVE